MVRVFALTYPFIDSSRLTVGSDTLDAFATSFCSQRRLARAALSCSPVSDVVAANDISQV